VGHEAHVRGQGEDKCIWGFGGETEETTRPRHRWGENIIMGIRMVAHAVD
jgi:hypothetical protein